MNNERPVRWMVTFWHSGGRSQDEPEFPEVDFWHSDKQTARAEAARVLIELAEQRGDKRDWVAAGHPDPFEVGIGKHPGGQWTLSYDDLDPDAGHLSPRERLKGMKATAGAWGDSIDGEGVKRMLDEARRMRTTDR